VESSEVVQLTRPRRGHFDLGTGYHGDLWLDLDAVNAGTAVAACVRELRAQGAVPVAVAALLALGEASAMVPASLGVPFYPADTMPSRAWPAPECPLCAGGVPVTPDADDGRSAPPAGR
jgi:hypothetical protein